MELTLVAVLLKILIYSPWSICGAYEGIFEVVYLVHVSCSVADQEVIHNILYGTA